MVNLVKVQNYVVANKMQNLMYAKGDLEKKNENYGGNLIEITVLVSQSKRIAEQIT